VLLFQGYTAQRKVSTKVGEVQFEKLSGLNNFLSNIATDLNYLFKLNVRFINLAENVSLQISEYDLRNVFSNLARNSAEASATEVVIEFDLAEGMGRFSFIDNGKGIRDDYRTKIFTDSFSTKQNGNGIGLSSLKKMFLEKGGNLELEYSSLKGTKFIFYLPLFLSFKNLVFVDNDKYLRMGWVQAGKKKGIGVSAFNSVDSFLAASAELSRDTQIYIDSDLGNNIKGEVESEKIFQSGFKYIFLSTSMDGINLENYPWLMGSVSKDFPF